MAGQTHSHTDQTVTRRVYSRDPDAFGVPTGREEEWRFTPLDRLGGLTRPIQPDGKIVVDVQAPAEVSVRTVGTDDPAIGGVHTPSNQVSALALAGIHEAMVVSVPAEVAASGPTFLTMRGEGGSQYGHLLVEVGAGAAAVVVVDHVGTATLASNVEYRIGAGAALTVVSIQDWEPTAVHVESQTALVGRDARFKHVLVTLGGALVRISPTVRFAGPGGDADLLGLYFTDTGQHQEHRVFIDHNAPRCRSRVTYKGALQGEDAHAVWIGDVLIRPEGVDTDTYELNRNLLLTEGARADSVPNLEITTGEVLGAGHASATGRFDDLQLFYLMSRGIPETEARQMVVRAFFAEVIDKIGVPELVERLTTAVDDELAKVGR
ncbi:MAG: Fe-S cluster assembly protein SufD [Actinobacteria bacterium]|nr:Fe-S cluster assembly protein SufD [Actinomycetota bacterium]